MKEEREYLGWAFWAMWVLANSVGWIVGMALLWVLSFVIDPLTQGITRVIGWGVGGAVVGAVFGVNEWFIFKPLGARLLGKWVNWWILATIVGWSISISIVSGLGAGEDLGFTVTGAVIGISVGIAQWFVLRPHSYQAEWWGLINTVGWIAGLAAIDLLDRAIGFSLTGVISGGITGGMMIWLLRHPRQETDEVPQTTS